MNNTQSVRAQEGQAGIMGLTEEERAVLNSVDHYLAAGLELKQWWTHASATNRFAERFELGLSYNRPDTGYGFFDETRVLVTPCRSWATCKGCCLTGRKFRVSGRGRGTGDARSDPRVRPALLLRVSSSASLRVQRPTSTLSCPFTCVRSVCVCQMTRGASASAFAALLQATRHRSDLPLL